MSGRFKGSVAAGALLIGLAGGCEAPPDAAPASEARPNPSASAAPSAPAKAGGVVFDPNNPPPGWVLCHRNHCHHQDGRVASYEQVMQEVGATSMVGGQAAPAAPPAPPDVASFPMDADRTESGLVTRVLKPGKGTRKPSANSVVTVHFTGWTTDGKAFDSSVARGMPATLSLDMVIRGWTEGMQLMLEGERTRFWIPENLAYRGEAGSVRGMLVFDVDLIRIER